MKHPFTQETEQKKRREENENVKKEEEEKNKIEGRKLMKEECFF